MKQLIIFLIVTTIIIVDCNYYFEYCVNREMPAQYFYPATIFIISIVALYIRYLIKLIINILNLKQQ